MPVSKSDLKFYLTGAEPFTAQTNTSQSIGAYPSTTEINPSSLLSSSIGFGSETLSVLDRKAGDRALIGSELISISGNSNTLDIVSRGAFNTDDLYHTSGSPVYFINKPNLFNGSFNESGKQYRCLAVKNTNAVNTFFNLKFYFKKSSFSNASNVKLAIEEPQIDVLNSTAIAGSTISITDTSLIGHPNDYFVGCPMTITNISSSNFNISRVIATFDNATGIMTFINAFSSPILSGDTFRIGNSPAQSLSSGTISPIFNSSHVSSLGLPSRGSPLSINRSGSRINGNNLGPNETVYLWFERTAISGVDSIADNRVIFTATYSTI
jgi:hypothetical protein